MNWKDFPNLVRDGKLDFFQSSDGCRLRYARWPSRDDSRGIVILVNGHREYMEKYYEFISDFLNKGFAVYTFDNRGQGRSDRALKNRLKSYILDFDLFPRDLNEFISNVVAQDPGIKKLPLILVGHSMGAHVCLRYLAEYSNPIHKAILMAPMLDFNLGSPWKSKITKIFIRLASKLGFGKYYGLGQGSVFSTEHHLINQRLLTHDRNRYMAEADIIDRNPDLYVGGATYAWLNSALDSMEKIKTAGYLKNVTLPILTFMAGDEKLVDNKAIKDLFSGKENISLFTLDGARHEMYREGDQFRDSLWQEIDDFLAAEQ